MTATRSIVATLAVVALIAAGVFVWQITRSSCPDEFGPGKSYSAAAEVAFAGKVWRAKVADTTEVPGPNATEWAAVGTC